MTDMRRCIGSTKFGIEAHEAPITDFPAQPSQQDGLGRMCKPHWNAYTSALRKAAQAHSQGDRARGWRAGRRRIARPPPADSRAPGANPGPFSVRSRRWPRAGSSRHVGQRGRPRPNLAGSLISDRDNSRNSAACTQSGGAVWQQRRRPRVYPTPVGRRTLRRVAGAAQDGGVGDVERGTASGQRHDVIDGQVNGRMGGALVARAPVAVLATPRVEHASAQALPSPRAVQRVMTAPVGLERVPGAAAASAARQQAADGAELHAFRLIAVPALTLVTLGCMPVAIGTSVMWRGAGVYPPAVLRL